MTEEQLSRREVLQALAGLLAGLFTAILSTTIVANALPSITADLGGTQRQYTWVVTVALLLMTVSTPVWGKLSDLVDKTRLVQIAIVIFAVGTLMAGLARSMPELILWRGLQGMGMGGLMACTQAILGSIVPPRERGRYSGYMGATFTVATVSGPVLGGVIVDTPLGWRWTFFVCLPLSLLSMILVRRTLRIEWSRRKAAFDVGGAFLLTVAASTLIVWITMAGDVFAWASTETVLAVCVVLASTVGFVFVERRHPDPLIDMRIMTGRTVGLAILASIAVGSSMFGATVYLGQYFQVAAAHSPTYAGVLTIPFMVGMFAGSAGSGPLITRTGRWKRFVVAGGTCLATGGWAVTFIGNGTPLAFLLAAIGLLGLGTGLLLQNLLLISQNVVDVSVVGATTATVAFFRSLGGALGVAVIGAVLGARVRAGVVDELGEARTPPADTLLDLDALPADVVPVVRETYGAAMGDAFIVLAVLATVTLLCVIALPNRPLRTTLAKTSEDGR